MIAPGHLQQLGHVAESQCDPHTLLLVRREPQETRIGRVADLIVEPERGLGENLVDLVRTEVGRELFLTGDVLFDEGRFVTLELPYLAVPRGHFRGARIGIRPEEDREPTVRQFAGRRVKASHGVVTIGPEGIFVRIALEIGMRRIEQLQQTFAATVTDLSNDQGIIAVQTEGLLTRLTAAHLEVVSVAHLERRPLHVPQAGGLAQASALPLAALLTALQDSVPASGPALAAGPLAGMLGGGGRPGQHDVRVSVLDVRACCRREQEERRPLGMLAIRADVLGSIDADQPVRLVLRFRRGPAGQQQVVRILRIEHRKGPEVVHLAAALGQHQRHPVVRCIEGVVEPRTRHIAVTVHTIVVVLGTANGLPAKTAGPFSLGHRRCRCRHSTGLLFLLLLDDFRHETLLHT